MEAEVCRKSRRRSRVNILGAIRQQPGLDQRNGASALRWMPVRVSARLDARRLKGGLGGGPCSTRASFPEPSGSSAQLQVGTAAARQVVHDSYNECGGRTQREEPARTTPPR
jgi:hypothetical protein